MTPRKKKEETVEVKDNTKLIELITQILEVIKNPTGKRETALKALLEALLNEIKS